MYALVMPKNMPVLDRWWQKVDRRADNECWPWTASRDGDGYGRFQVPTATGQRHTRAHRWIFEQIHGPVPDGMVIMHVCDHPWCVNPNHLRLGTPLDNNDDKVAKGRHARLWGTPLKRSRQTHCKHGHEFTPENTKVNDRGHRTCRTCLATNARRHYWRNKVTPDRLEEVVTGARSS